MSSTRALTLLGLTFGLFACKGDSSSSKEGEVNAGNVDADGDGVPASTDCDDGDPAVNPAATEVCNGQDDDCDGLIDDADDTVDPADLVQVYPDADGDGFGDANSAGAARCALEAGESETATDCDDTDAAVNPAAAEACDGRDTDCEPGTGEAGLVSHIGDDGLITDWTEAFVAGTESSPAALTLDVPGRYQLCEGTFYAHLSVGADLSLLGIGAVALDGGGGGTVLSIADADYVVELEDLTLQNGLGLREIGGVGTGGSGGGLYCDGESAISMTGVTVRENQAEVGAGAAVKGCSLTAVDSSFTANAGTWGTGLHVEDGATIDLTGGLISENLSTSGGGALYLYNGADVALHSVQLTRNAALGTATAGITINDASLRCDSGESRTATSITANGGPDGGPALRLYNGSGTASFVADGCDFGEWGAADDNASPEIETPESDRLFTAGDSVRFSCDGLGCGEPTEHEVGRSDEYVELTGAAAGTVFYADRALTLDGFSVSALRNLDCALDFAVMTNTTLADDGWTVVWKGSSTGGLGRPGMQDSPPMSLLVNPGTYYALVYGWSCTTDSGAGATFDLTRSDGGLGEAVGWVYTSPLLFDVEGPIDLGIYGVGGFDASIHIHTVVSVTEL